MFGRWNSKLLSERERDEVEAGGFGHGLLDRPLCPQVAVVLDSPPPPVNHSPQPQVLYAIIFCYRMTCYL